MLIFDCPLNTMYRFSLTQFFSFRRWSISAFLIAVPILLFAACSFAQGGENPGDAVAVFNQAQVAHEKGDLSAAIKLYEKALKIVPEFPEAEYQRGVALLSLGKMDDAEKAFRHAVQLRADWTLAATALASILVQKGQFAEAEPMLTRVIDADPQNSSAFTAMTEL